MNQLLMHAEAEQAADHLTEYLSTTVGTLYAGRLFDKWARPDVPYFVFDDIVAVKALSVEVPAEATDKLMEDADRRFTELIAELGGYTIADDFAKWESAANELHRRLKKLDGVAGVIAGKLMHAKLPRLIPIWDDKTQKGLDYQQGRYWARWHEDYNQQVQSAVSKLRQDVPLAEHLSDLRILDIVIWKIHENS